MQPSTLVVFSHGKESGPHGRKIQALAHLAQSLGAETVSIDYREHPAGVLHDHDQPGEAERRVEQLLATPLPDAKRLILVGSSMGGFVSVAAASRMGRLSGLFLLAPALLMPGYSLSGTSAQSDHFSIVHGWRDEVVPWEHSVRYAAEHRCRLHLVDSDHRLESALPEILALFRLFLVEVMNGQDEGTGILGTTGPPRATGRSRS